MKLALIYGPFSTGQRPFDFANLWDSPRGLTGSEVSCIRYACAMADRGHDVTLAVAQDQDLGPSGVLFRTPAGNTIWIISLRHFNPVAYDAVLSWNEPDMLRGVPPTTLRVVDQQLNDFTYCQPGWQAHVDLLLSPSAHHLDYLHTVAQLPASGVLPNGCDPEEYMLPPFDASVEREAGPIPGRVIWASSADRGLHLLLQAWPEIKRRVPHASLRCFYHWSYDGLLQYETLPGMGPPHGNPDIIEIGQRARYIKHAVSLLKDLDVQHIGGVSRSQIRDAFMQAQVLAYPCQPIRWTEGFSVTSMEACAAGCVPVLTDVDAIGSIYAGLPMVPSPAGAHLPEFVELVVKGLTDDAFRAEVTERGRALAAAHAWPVLAERLEAMLFAAMDGRAGAKHG